MKTRRRPLPGAGAARSLAPPRGTGDCARAGAASIEAAAAPRPRSTPAARILRRPAEAPPRSVSARIGASLLRLGLVARPIRGIRRVEAGQRRSGLDLFHDPAFEALLLERQRGDFLDHAGRNQDRAVAVGDDDVVREHRHTAATHGLLPVDEGEAGHRGWRRRAARPDRKPGLDDAGEVAHHGVAHPGGHSALRHAGAEDVAPEAGVAHAVGIDHRDAAGGHLLDRGARRLRRAPGLRGRQVLAGGNEAHGEGAADDAAALCGRGEGAGAADPGVAQALLEQDGRQRGGGHACQRGEGVRVREGGHGGRSGCRAFIETRFPRRRQTKDPRTRRGSDEAIRAGRSRPGLATGLLAYMPMPMPPMPPMSGMPPAGLSSGSSPTIAAVVSIRPAIEAAFCSAVRVTLVGSTTPSSTRSPYSPLAALKPKLPLPSRTLATTTLGSSPAFATIWRRGSSTARRTMRTPASWSGLSPLTLIAARARSRATPPPGTMPSSTAARVACSASSTRAFFSFISTSVAAPTRIT